MDMLTLLVLKLGIFWGNEVNTMAADALAPICSSSMEMYGYVNPFGTEAGIF